MSIASNTSTLEEFASLLGSGEIMNYNFSILDVKEINGETIQFEPDSIINDYLDLLKEKSVEVELDEQEKIKYFYNPELLSFDIYGTTELDFLILKLNGIIDPKEFNLSKVKLLKQEDLKTLLSNIYNAEKEFLELNRSEFGLVLP